MRKKRSRPQAPLSFEYVAKPVDGSPDQTLTMTNHTETAVRPTLAFIPHNMYGMPMPKVEVRTVLGTHLGAALLPGHATVQDILRFDGPGAQDVRAVQIAVTDIEELEHPPLDAGLRAVMVDLDQKATLDPEDFWGVGVANGNPFGVQVRVALVAFEDRVGDQPQQVEDVVTLEGDIEVASESHEVIWLPENVRGMFHHVAWCLVPQTLV